MMNVIMIPVVAVARQLLTRTKTSRDSISGIVALVVTEWAFQLFL